MPRLHVLVSERELDLPDGLAVVRRIMERAAPNAVHLRARVPARRLFEVSCELVAVAERVGGWLIVNGRPDIALAAGARAVQLGRTALGVRDARRLVEPRVGILAIGASVHGAEGAVQAVREGADYLVLGTIYPTASHPGVPGSGPAALTTVRERLPADRRAPILAIGGVRADRVRDVIDGGAHGVVVGRAVWAAPDPVEAALELRTALNDVSEDAGADVDGLANTRER